MPRLRWFLCFAIIIAMIPAMIYCFNMLPVETGELAAEKYNNWSGVLRIWLYDGWMDGSSSLITWLGRCTSSFEKNNPGVYVQIQSVDSTAIEYICENGLIPPDIILFPPGLLSAPHHLVPLAEKNNLLYSLDKAGSYNGMIYAHPIAMGGYVWAYNSELINSIPSSWKNTDTSIAISSDSAYHYWSSALTFLCSGKYLVNDIFVQNTSAPNMDLDLSLIEPTPKPIQTPVPSEEDYMYCSLPEKFSFSKTTYQDFISGDISATVFTQQEIKRLMALSEQGKGPEWKISISGDISFTDQILYASVVNKPESPEKTDLCISLIDHFLSEDCQNIINTAGLFSVTDTTSGYDSYHPLQKMESMIKSIPVYTSHAFQNFRETSLRNIVRIFLENGSFSKALYHEIMDIAS